MTAGTGHFRSAILLAAAVGIFGHGSTCLRAAVLAQGATGITIDLGKATRLAPEEVHDRGIRLRADLDKAFKALPDSGKAGHADEFTAIVRPYIAAGTGLDDAVDILTAAGFTAPPRAGAREAQDRNSATERYVIVAEIPQFSGRVFGNVEATVMLLPADQSLAEFVGRRHRMMYDPRP